MDVVLYLLGLVLILVGVAGCIVPGIPGPPISFFGILMLNWTSADPITSDFLWLWGSLAVAVTVLDYIVPIWGTKKYGGSKYGTWGSVIGLFLGLFLGPIGVIAGPFAGAFVGEMIYGRTQEDAFRSGMGSFIGFVIGTGIKLVVSGVLAAYYFKYAFVAIKDLF